MIRFFLSDHGRPRPVFVRASEGSEAGEAAHSAHAAEAGETAAAAHALHLFLGAGGGELADHVPHHLIGLEQFVDLLHLHAGTGRNADVCFLFWILPNCEILYRADS